MGHGTEGLDLPSWQRSESVTRTRWSLCGTNATPASCLSLHAPTDQTQDILMPMGHGTSGSKSAKLDHWSIKRYNLLATNQLTGMCASDGFWRFETATS